MADSKRRSARQRAERKRSIYFEPETDDDFDDEESEGEEDFQPEPAPGPSQLQRPKKKRKIETRRRPETRSKDKRKQQHPDRPARKTKRRGLNWVPSSSAAKTSGSTSKGFSGPSDGKIPDWKSLPAEILRQIFVFASQPIHDQTTTASANVTWLMRAARTCRSFAVPALEAFYEFPAFHNSLQPHLLLELVSKEQDSLYINYKSRIRSVNFDVRRLAYVAQHKQVFDVSTLVRSLPRLQAVEFVHPVDSPPYRELQRTAPWLYPSDLVESLSNADIRLKSFRWTRDRVPAEWSADVSDLYARMTAVHTSKPFQYVERLVLCGFDFKNSALELLEGMTSRPHGLESAISTLPNVKDLTFISCEVVMEDFLEQLPWNLERLELSNCLEVTSDMISSYLTTGGAHLRELVLNHNAALNLAFLQHLAARCPRLEVLIMDLTYYSERFNSNDAIALYDQLLTEDQTPTWPSTLRHLELLHLQKWEAEAAQNLFRSLIDSAKDLPDLRHLVLQAHISIPWRDRAHFRDQWIDRLQRVYLRKQEPPLPHLGSMKQFRLWKLAQGPPSRPEDDHGSDNDDTPLRRRLSHIRVTPRKAPADTHVYATVASSAHEPASSRPRRSGRAVETQSATTAEESALSSEFEDESQGWRKQSESFIHGLCEVVDIRIDNQRPRENQFTEANFLDSEPSGDEDWREGADGSDEDRYAW